MTTVIAEPIKKLAPPPIPADAGSPTVNIAVSRIVPSPWNRKAEVTDDLVESVRKNGVVQNVVLRPHKATEEDVALYSMKADPFKAGDSIFQLVAGERRWGAAKKAGRSHIPAAIRQLSDIEAMDFQIDENENRKNLRPMERAEAYDRLRMLYQEAHAKDKDYTEEKAIAAVAASRNVSTRTVYEVISLKKLTPNAQHALRNGEMEASHGTAMSGRSPEDQEKLLLWLRQQTHHSQGDVPSVRRLKLEIRQLDLAAEDKKRQEKLFKEPQPGTSTTKVPTVAEAAIPGAKSILPEYRAAREAAAPQTPAPETRTVRAGLAGTREVSVAPKPLSQAQIKKNTQAEEKRRVQEAKAQRDRHRNDRIDSSYKASLFARLATKATINSRLLTHVVPEMILHVMDDQLPIEAFAHDVLKWPAPKDGNEYTIAEVRLYSKKHTRKFSPSLLAAMAIVLFNGQSEIERMARYFGVDPKKLRNQAAAAVKEEERIARIPKEPTEPKERVLFNHVEKWDEWARMRKKGASDQEIRGVLCKHFGEYGGSHAPNRPSIVYRGTANNPRVWFKMSDTGKPALGGSELVAKVRDLLKIPEKGDVDA